MTAIGKNSEKGMPPVRVAKYLANAGLASRRTVEEWIAQGRVSVNGKVLDTPAVLVVPGEDRILCDGREVCAVPLRYVMLNKPRGYTCSAEDRHARRLVYDLLPKELHHLHYVGRLDRETEGMLLFTNDGELLFALTHPSREVHKVYAALCGGSVRPGARENMLRGMRDDGEWIQAVAVEVRRQGMDETLLRITLKEGKKHEVRRLCARVGLPVLRLARIEQGGVALGELAEGRWRDLTVEEVRRLRESSRGPAGAGTGRAGRLEKDEIE